MIVKEKIIANMPVLTQSMEIMLSPKNITTNTMLWENGNI